MSGVISFRTDDEVVDTVDRIVEQTDEDVSRALVTKRLVEEAVEARETPLWVRVGLSDRRAAQIEAMRQEGETEEDLARELFTEALEAREDDVLDTIGASDELRELVEENREEGETLDAAVRRLVRKGGQMRTTYRGIVVFTAGIAGLMLVSILITVFVSPAAAAAGVGFMLLLALLYPQIRPLVDGRLGV